MIEIGLKEELLFKTPHELLELSERLYKAREQALYGTETYKALDEAIQVLMAMCPHPRAVVSQFGTSCPTCGWFKSV